MTSIVIPATILEMKQCEHGERVYKVGESPNGFIKFRGYLCPRDVSTEKIVKDTACKPIWVDAGGNERDGI